MFLPPFCVALAPERAILPACAALQDRSAAERLLHPATQDPEHVHRSPRDGPRVQKHASQHLVSRAHLLLQAADEADPEAAEALRCRPGACWLLPAPSAAAREAAAKLSAPAVSLSGFPGTVHDLCGLAAALAVLLRVAAAAELSAESGIEMLLRVLIFLPAVLLPLHLHLKNCH